MSYFFGSRWWGKTKYKPTTGTSIVPSSVVFTSVPSEMYEGSSYTIVGTVEPVSDPVIVYINNEVFGTDVSTGSGVFSITGTITSAMVGGNVEVKAVSLSGSNDIVIRNVYYHIELLVVPATMYTEEVYVISGIITAGQVATVRVNGELFGIDNTTADGTFSISGTITNAMVGAGVEVEASTVGVSNTDTTTVLFLSQKIAAYYTDDGLSAFEVWVGDSRTIWSASMAMAEVAPDINYTGWNLTISPLDIWWNSERENTASSNIPPTHPLADPFNWDRSGLISMMTGVHVGPSGGVALQLRLGWTTAVDFATYPTLSSRVIGHAATFRGYVYGCADKVVAVPDVGIWIRCNNEISVSATSPLGDSVGISGIGPGEYGVASVTLPESWSSSTTVYTQWLAQDDVDTVVGEKLALGEIQFGISGGVWIYNDSVGGEQLALHWIDPDVMPDPWFTSVLPIYANGRQVIARIDVGTNGGDEDADFITHMHELIARVRNVFPDAIVGIYTAYDTNTDTSSKTYVGRLYTAFNVGEFSNAYFIDSRAGLDSYPVALAAGYMADGTHRNVTGHADQGVHLNTWILQMRNNGNFTCRITTSLVANPYTHGVPGIIAGNCYPANSDIEILNNSGTVIATTTGVAGLWSTTITLPSAGAQNISARCVRNGFTTTRPTVVA